MITKYKALLFDLNGTMIDDMEYHVRAWHRILNRFGANISMQRMKQESYGKNADVIERVLPGRFSPEEKKEMSLEKEADYQASFRPRLKLIKGLDEFLKRNKQAGIRMAIGSAAIMSNIDFVIDGLHIRNYFDVLVSADDVQHSKPSPETWLLCANRLQVPPHECLVFEDTPPGVVSAAKADMNCIVITSMHEAEDFNKEGNILRFIKDYTELES
jgi:beta-phosphoglucomutase family hydrolase